MQGLDPSLLDLITDAVVRVDGDWRYTYVNRRAADLIGREPELLIGDVVLKVSPEGRGSTFQHACERAMRERVPVVVEDYFVPWGRWLECRVHPDADGLSILFCDASERRAKEVAVLRSEERFRTIFHQSPAGIFLFDAGLQITECNPRLVTLLASSFERLVGLDLRTIRNRGVLDVIEQAIAGREGCYEGPYAALTSEVRVWVSLRTAPLRDEAGTVIGGIGIVEDITERKRVEAALRASEDRFGSLVRATSSIVWSTSPTGEVDQVVWDWQAFTGQRFEEYRGWGWLAAFHADERARVAAVWRESIERRTTFEIEHRLRRYDGEYRLMRARAVPVLDADGAITEWVGAHEDITESTRAVQALRAAEERFRVLVEGVRDYAIYTLDPGGAIRSWNAGAEAITGYVEEEILGSSFGRLYGEEARAAGLPESVLREASARGRYEEEGWRVRKDGSLVFVAGHAERGLRRRRHSARLHEGHPRPEREAAGRAGARPSRRDPRSRELRRDPLPPLGRLDRRDRRGARRVRPGGRREPRAPLRGRRRA
jgi:PAS domain S-box-containing protein